MPNEASDRVAIAQARDWLRLRGLSPRTSSDAQLPHQQEVHPETAAHHAKALQPPLLGPHLVGHAFAVARCAWVSHEDAMHVLEGNLASFQNHPLVGVDNPPFLPPIYHGGERPTPSHYDTIACLVRHTATASTADKWVFFHKPSVAEDVLCLLFPPESSDHREYVKTIYNSLLAIVAHFRCHSWSTTLRISPAHTKWLQPNDLVKRSKWQITNSAWLSEVEKPDLLYPPFAPPPGHHRLACVLSDPAQGHCHSLLWVKPTVPAIQAGVSRHLDLALDGKNSIIQAPDADKPRILFEGFNECLQRWRAMGAEWGMTIAGLTTTVDWETVDNVIYLNLHLFYPALALEGTLKITLPPAAILSQTRSLVPDVHFTPNQCPQYLVWLIVEIGFLKATEELEACFYRWGWRGTFRVPADGFARLKDFLCPDLWEHVEEEQRYEFRTY